MTTHFFAKGTQLKKALMIGCVLFASIYALSPLMNAWFHLDDFWMLTMGRHTNRVGSFWLEDHSKFYFFRPLSLSIWWFTTQGFGQLTAYHYAFNVSLHILVATGFSFWINRVSRSRWLALLGFAVYMLHPIAVRTTASLSDRFDLLATAAVFFSLHAFSHGAVNWRWKLWFLVCASAAFTSKESGLTLLVVLVAHYFFDRRQLSNRLSGQLTVLMMACTVATVYLVTRQALLAFNGLVVADSNVGASIFVGGIAYITTIATALVGVPELSPPHLSSAVLLLLIVVIGALVTRHRHTHPRAFESFFLGSSLLFACVCVHANIALYNLNVDRVNNEIISVRLFHLALGALFMLLVVPTALFVHQRTKNIQRIASAIGVFVLLVWTVSSHRYAEHWKDETQSGIQTVILDAVKNVETIAIADRCIVQFLGVPTLHRTFGETSDLMVKAFLQKNSPAMRCVFLTERSPFLVITPVDTCDSKRWSPHLPIRLNIGAKPFANLCYHFFDQADNAALLDHPNLVRFHWTDDRKFVRLQENHRP
jgi:hypothetical protein